MEKIMKFRLTVLPLVKLKRININPSVRVEEKKLLALKNAIQKSKLVVPLVVILKSEKYLILDGNRRYAICQELQINEVPCLIIEDTKIRAEELFVLLNLQLKMDGYQRLIIMKEANIFFNKTEEIKYNYLVDIGGLEIINLMIEKRNNATYTYHWLIELSKYLKVYGKEELKNIVRWLVENKQQYQTRKAIEMKVNKSLILDAINKDRPLKGYVFN